MDRRQVKPSSSSAATSLHGCPGGSHAPAPAEDAVVALHQRGELSTAITGISRARFVSGMHSAFLVAAAMALAGAVIALVIRQRSGAADTHAGV